MLAISYCSECFVELNQYGELAIALFQQTCEHYLIAGECLCVRTNERFYNYSGVISFLENKGYLISTECGKSLLKLKPLGIECETEDGKCFCHVCFDKEDHE